MANLSPRQRAYIRKRTAFHAPDPSEEMGELNIIPFLDIVVNLVMFLLATVQAVLAISQIDAQLPSLGRRVGRQELDSGQSSLNLSVTITSGGVIVAGSGGKLAPGCESTQTGRVITVPAAGGSMVWSIEGRNENGEPTHQEGATTRALRECLTLVKRTWPDETRVILSADPEIQFEHIVGAMDAMRGTDASPLFPDVLLSAGVR